ncbi:HAD family hydrolase [Flavobacteriaceae bacterium CRH]|nr:HAD family hydrolase [Flavobacteriaceae bacterium CRH]
MKKLIIFDLDGTLCQSKLPIDTQMGILIANLLQLCKVAVVSGGSWKQFEMQLLANLPKDCKLHGLSLLPVCGTQFYQYSKGWKLLYCDELTAPEKDTIINALNSAVKQAGVLAEKTWGPLIEDRSSQITFSALGQCAPLDEKIKWDADRSKRKKIKENLEQLLPEFSIRLGGTTSIDVTKKGIDKAYAVTKLRDTLKIPFSLMEFIGDALFPQGNDYPVIKTGIETIRVKDSKETTKIIKTIIKSLCSKQGLNCNCPKKATL